MKRKGKNESSPTLIDIQNTIKELTECKDQNEQIRLLTKFEISYEEFLMDTENQKLIDKYALSFTNQMMNFSFLAINSVHLLIPILRILLKVHPIITITINPKEAVPLFISIFTTGNSFSNTIEECSPVIEYFFKDEAFFSFFLAQNGIYIIFQTAFFQNTSTEHFSQFINILLFKKIPILHYQTFQFEDFFLDILRIKLESISTKIISEYLFFISHLFYIMSHFVKNASTFFIEKGLFALYDKLVEKEMNNQHLQNYKIFISSLNDDFSEPPNSQFILQIYDKYQKSEYLSSVQNDYFQLILAFIVTDSKSATKINETTPFIDYFKLPNPPIKHLVSLLAGANSVKPDLIPSCIPPLFLKLIAHETETSNYRIIVNIVEKQIKNKRINSEFLLNSGFVTVFFCNAPEESLFDIFSNDPYFHTVTIDVFKLPASSAYQQVIFKSVLNLYDFYDDKIKFSNLIQDYLMISPTQTIMTLLINKITEKESTELFNALLNVFNVKKEASENFVNADGINWVFEIYNDHLIKVKQIANILAKLVTFEGIPELDLAIRKLPQDHQLFQLPSNFLINVVYGENPQFPVIRTTAMIPFIPPIKDLDPYNAYILGCRFVKQYKDNLFDMPMLNEVMNRFVKPEFISQLLARPQQLSDFVDMKYDQFPLFQFFSMNSNTTEIADDNNNNNNELIDELSLNVGKNYLLLQRSFLGLSFWFKFSEEIKNNGAFFRTNNFTLSITPKNELVVNCENTIKEVPIDPLNWCHIFIKIKSSLMARMITLYVNQTSYHFVTKLQTFTFVCFSHLVNGIMFLGSAIRFYDILTIRQEPIDFKILFKKGAGFMRGFLSKEEEIITPSRINISSMVITVPENCFCVPYFGFAMHFSSVKHLDKLIKILENSENQELYDSLFRLILRIRSIDELSNHFFTRIISSMKRNSKYLTTDHFISFLRTFKAKSIHIPLILYDKDLWKYVSNDIIIESLFEYYSSGINWESFENIELFLSTIVCENPLSKTIVNVLLSNHAKVPKFMKFLISILKIAPTIRQANCSWESVEFREETQIQHTIIDCLCSFTQQSTVDLVISLLSFEDLRSLMIVSPSSISAKVFHLISNINKYSPNFIPQNDATFITAVSFLSGYESVWNDILEMKQINFPLYLILIWAGGICLIHQNTYDIQSNSHTEKLENLVKDSIEKLSSNNLLVQILNNELCLSMITSWFPFILHYNVLFQAFPESESNVTKIFEPLTLAQFPEFSDPVWIGAEQVLNETAFPIPPPPSKASQFMLEKVTSVLTSNHFQVPFPPLSSMKRVSQWFLQSPLLPFLTDLILLSPPHLLNKVLYAFFFEFVIGNPQHSDPLTPIFFQSMLNRLSNFFTSSAQLSAQSVMTTNQILQFLHILTGLQYLQDSSLIIISDLLTLAQLIQTKQGNSVMMKYTGSIEPIILSLFSAIRITDYQDIFSLLTNNIQVFASLITAEKSQLTWIYVFFIASHNERKLMNPFLNKLTPLLKLDQKSSKLMSKLINKTMDMDSVSTIEDAWKQKSNDFQLKFKQYYTAIKDVKPAFPTEIGLLSCDYKHLQFLSNAKHYLVSRLFSNTMKYFSTSFLIKQEQNQWSRITRELLENPKPMKKEHLSPFFFPYSLPRVLTPSPYPFININKDVNIRSVPIKLFKQNILYSYSLIPDNKPSTIKMFIDLNADLGQPSFVSNCSILRYNGVIPSVLFMFNDQLKIVCNCQLNQKEDDIDLNKEIKTSLNHFFVESVLIGHWGVTEMFASKIVVTVKLTDLINIQKYKDLSVIIYSFTVGNFILDLPRKDLQTKILKLKESIISNYSFYSISSSNSESNKKPKSRPKTLTISVPGTDSNQVIKIKPKARRGTLFPNFNWETDFNINETIQNFCTGKSSAFETLLRINTVCGRSFLSLDNYPIAPQLNFEEIMKNDDDRPYLTNLQPLCYFQNSINIDESTKPLSFFGCIDFFDNKNLCHFFKLRESLESDSSKIIILNIISNLFEIKFEKMNLKSDIYERKNIGIVISELNSPLNFAIAPASSTSVLPESFGTANGQRKNDQTEQMEEDQLEIEPIYNDHTLDERADEELVQVEHTDEEIERTDTEMFEDEIEDDKVVKKHENFESSKIAQEEKSENKETDKVVEEEEEVEEEKFDKKQENKETDEIVEEEEEAEEEKSDKKQENKETDKVVKEEEEVEEEKSDKKQENDKIVEEEEEAEEEKSDKKQDEDKKSDRNGQAIEDEEDSTRSNDDEKFGTAPSEASPLIYHSSNDNTEEEADQDYSKKPDLSFIIKSVESSDISDLVDPLSLPDGLLSPPDSEDQTPPSSAAQLYRQHQKPSRTMSSPPPQAAAPTSSSTPASPAPVSPVLEAASKSPDSQALSNFSSVSSLASLASLASTSQQNAESGPVSATASHSSVSLLTPTLSPTPRAQSNDAKNRSKKPSRTLTSSSIPQCIQTAPVKVTNISAKDRMKSKSISNLPDRSLLFTPRKIYQMNEQSEIAMFSKIDRILPLPKLSEICINHFVVTIESIEMKIISRKGRTVFASIANPHFEYATSISVSRNGLFVVVDTELSISETYQIHYREGNPVRFESKYSMSFDDGVPKSIVDGESWSVITKIGDKICIWNLFRNYTYRTFDTKAISQEAIDANRNSNDNGNESGNNSNNNSNDNNNSSSENSGAARGSIGGGCENDGKVLLSQNSSGFCSDFLEAFSYDEGFDIIWFVTKLGVCAISSSGRLIGFHSHDDLGSEITAMKAVNLPIWQVNRIALLGDVKGRVYFAYISYDEKKIEVRKLLKLHSCQIVQFDVNQDFTIFLSTDVNGNIYTWKI